VWDRIVQYTIHITCNKKQHITYKASYIHKAHMHPYICNINLYTKVSSIDT